VEKLIWTEFKVKMFSKKVSNTNPKLPAASLFFYLVAFILYMVTINANFLFAYDIQKLIKRNSFTVGFGIFTFCSKVDLGVVDISSCGEIPENWNGNGPVISRFQNFAVVSGVLGGVGIVVMVIHQLTVRYKLASLSDKVNKFFAVLSPLLLLLSGVFFVLCLTTFTTFSGEIAPGGWFARKALQFASQLGYLEFQFFIQYYLGFASAGFSFLSGFAAGAVAYQTIRKKVYIES